MPRASVAISALSAKSKSKYILAMFPYPSGTLHMGHFRVYTISDVLARFYAMQPQHVKVECRGDAVELSGGSNAVGAAQRTPRNSLHSQTTESKIKKTGNNISSARQSVIHPFGWDAFGLPAERAALLHNTPASQWTSSNIASMKEQVHKMGLRLDWDREIATNDPKYYKWTQWIFLRMHASGLVEYKESAVLWDPVDQTVLANEQVVNGRAERSGALVVHKKLKQYFLKITRYAERLDKDLSGLDWPSSVISQQRNWIGKRKGVSISGNVDTARLNVFAIYGSADGGNCIDKASKVVENSQAAYVAIGPTHPLLDTLNKNTKTGRDVQVFINALLHGRNNSFDRYGGINTGLFWSPNSNSEESQTSANDSNDVLPIWIRNSMVHLPPESAILGQTTDVFSVKNGISPSSTRSIPNSTNRTLNWTRLVSAGSPATTYNLRDWLVSRQRAWGTPIPMAPVPIPETMLPVFIDSPIDIPCPRICSSDKMEQGLPVDVYIGGVEHAVMHLLYARFVAKFLVDDGVIDPLGCAMPNGEPFTKLVSQGLVKTDTFSDAQGRYTATPSKVRRVEKMSKSKMNGVDPTSVIDSYGSDVARLYILSKASPQDPIIWDIKGVVGMDRWMRRLWALLDECWPELFGRRESVMKSADEIPHIEVAWPLVDDSVVCSGSGDICDKYTRLVGGHFGQMRLHLCITELLKMTREITEIQISNEKELGAKRNACIRLLELLLPFAPRTSSHILSRLAQLNARLNRTE